MLRDSENCFVQYFHHINIPLFIIIICVKRAVQLKKYILSIEMYFVSVTGYHYKFLFCQTNPIKGFNDFNNSNSVSRSGNNIGIGTSQQTFTSGFSK